jgi:tRNA threonylcarbamoyladenosine biosynthesis protein TsaE
MFTRDDTVKIRPSTESLPSGTWITRSSSETIEFGKALAKRLARGDVVALYGELGSGKTTLVKGLVAGLGATDPDRVRSPTFVLLNLYKGRLPVYHVDLYRVQNVERLHDIAYEEYASGDGVTVIEWAEKAEQLLPDKAVRVRLKMLGKRSREIHVEFPDKNRNICR